MGTIQSQMTTPVTSINSEATAQEAAQLMKEKEIGSLLVKGCQGYVGILAERDLAYRLVCEGMDPRTTSSLFNNGRVHFIHRPKCLSFRCRFSDAGIQYQSSGCDGKG